MSENQTNTAAAVVKYADMTKEQKLAYLDAQLAKLAQKRDDVANDRVTVRVGKAVYVPEIGDKVFAVVGRNTATSQAKTVPGVVVAVKHPAEGEKGATQVRVRIGEGFDEQLVTLYPANLTKQVEEVAAA